MITVGNVRAWHEDEGWGVLDSPATPGGCWVHFSHIVTNGYRGLLVGQQITLEWESPGQDGYPYRAVHVWPDETRPDEAGSEAPASSAYRSDLDLRFDESD